MKKQAGMTLIELVIVIIVLGIIAAVAAPKFVDVSGNAVTAAIDGSQGAFKSAYVISVAEQQGVPQEDQLKTRLDGFTCALTTCDTPDNDNDTNPDLRVTLYSDAACTTVVVANALVNGYDFDRNGAGAVCQTN